MGLIWPNFSLLSNVVAFNISRWDWMKPRLRRPNPGTLDMQPLTLLPRLTFPSPRRDAIDNLIRDSGGLHLTAAADLLLITVFSFGFSHKWRKGRFSAVRVGTVAEWQILNWIFARCLIYGSRCQVWLPKKKVRRLEPRWSFFSFAVLSSSRSSWKEKVSELLICKIKINCQSSMHLMLVKTSYWVHWWPLFEFLPLTLWH